MSKRLIHLVSFVLLLGLTGVTSGTEGLKGEYYHATIAANEWQDLVLTRIDPKVDFDWGANSPEPGVVNADNFTVRWTGTIEVPESETYTFYTEGDDGIKLWVNNELVIDTWTWSKTWHVTQPPIEFGSGEIALTAGQQYEIKLEHYEHGGTAKCKLSWSTATMAQEIVPSQYLSVERPYPRDPDPADGAIVRDSWVGLDWTPGDFAATHDVYLGESFNDVYAGAAGTFRGSQAEMTFTVGFPGFPYPDGLISGTTYYWRIVEVNDTHPGSPWEKGPVWSFSVAPRTAYNPNPVDGAELVDTNPELSWEPGFNAKLRHFYFGDNYDDVDAGTGGTDKGPMGHLIYFPGPLKLSKTYYWRVDEFDPPSIHKGEVWSFTTQGAVANPNPANGAVDVTQRPILSWSPGIYSASYQVYFGSDSATLELKGSGDLGSEGFEAGQLDWNTTYYWRIDEANNANADSPWTGPLWSFTTADFFIVDDFESYNDLDPADAASNRIFFAWVDGFDNPAVNGSVVGYGTAPFAEQAIVHSGNQSMPLAYDNAVGKSEATLTLTSNRDWTVNGVNTLTIWFRGSTGNAAENMYVALNGNAAVNNDNPEAAVRTSWTRWDIDLMRFADQGVNLTNVISITLGLGNRSNPVAGGAGMMYFDDIRLYAPVPEAP
ncbi:MAG: PA14 domain-containing protein [Sedimentisphaerales bacterium]|nr:PA14 domain-containing protein [Sedimentisphaerales bacterium]